MAKIDSESFVAPEAGYSMKSLLIKRQSWIGTFRKAFVSRLARCSAAAVMLLVLGWWYDAAAQLQMNTFDDFSDGNDTLSPPWTHLSGYVGSSGQSWDASTGVYRLQAPTNGLDGLGFVGSHVGDVYTDVKVWVDIVSFVGSPAGAVFGVAARLNGNNAVGGLTGYAYVYEPFASSGAGAMVLYRINPGISISDIGSQPVTLNPNKDYTFVLEVIGPNLHGQVFEVGGGMVAEKFEIDATYPSGFSGLIAYSQNPMPPVDFSVDNFLAHVAAPGISTIFITSILDNGGNVTITWTGGSGTSWSVERRLTVNGAPTTIATGLVSPTLTTPKPGVEAYYRVTSP